MTVDSVPMTRLGEIRQLPGIGRRFITLWNFHREGLAQLEKQPPFESHMLTNRRLLEAGKKLQNWIPRSPNCDACGRSFLEINGNVPLTSHSTQHDLVMVTPMGRHAAARHFCWDCASSRDTLIEVCGNPFAQSIAEDGVDVFAFVAQTIYEDRLADILRVESLQCHNGKYASKYSRMIGGRLQKLIDDGQYAGPLHPVSGATDPGPTNNELPLAATSTHTDQAAVDLIPGSGVDIPSGATPSLDDEQEQFERQRTLAKVILRPKQAEFRSALLDAYGSRCAITGCSAPLALQAAHIIPVSKDGVDSTRNGILLRADLHLLFDAGLIAIDCGKMTVEIAPALAGTEYESLEGRSVRVPEESTNYPSPSNLNRHRIEAMRGWSK